jgi:hypothetical protein
VRASEDVAHVVDFLVTDLFTDDEALFSGFVTWPADIPHRPGVSVTTLFSALDLLG